MKLSLQETERIERRLNRAGAASGDPNFVGVGFGVGIKLGAIDTERPRVVRYFVKRKLKRPSPAFRIPAEITVRIKRKNRFVRVTLKTDVMEIGNVVPTGVHLHADGRENNVVTTGVLVTWRSLLGDRCWGIVTVAHGFSASDRGVKIRPIRRASFDGEVIAKTRRGTTFDAALVEIKASDVSKIPGASANSPPQEAIRAMSFDQVRDACEADQAGRSYRLPGPKRLKAMTYFVSPFDFGGKVGKKRHVIQVEADVHSAFQKGTSGSMWKIGDQPAGMQFAGRCCEFKVGYGHFLCAVLEWAKGSVSGTRFRFVHAF